MYTLNQDGTNYFRLQRPRNMFKKALIFLVKLPFLPIIALFSALVTVLAMAPTFAVKQRIVHCIDIEPSDAEQNKNSIAIINVTPHSSFKTLFDFLRKPLFTLKQFFPFLPIHNRTYLKFDNKQDKAYVDKVITEYMALKNGTSTQKNCENKIFNDTNIYLKGLEHLDDRLKKYINEKLYSQQDKLIPINFFSLETPGGAILDSVEVTSVKHNKTPFKDRNFIITCMPRDQNFIQWIKELKTVSEQTEKPTTTISFNYRGSDRSQGMMWSGNNLVNDAAAQVHRLLALGVPVENITIEGHCIGGNIATLAAAKLHRQGHKVKVYSDRSMRSINRLLLGLFWPKNTDPIWHPLTWCKCFLVLIEYLIVLPALWFTRWRLDAADALNTIPETHFDYSVIRNSSDPNPLHREDGLIQDSWASVASKISAQNSQQHCFCVDPDNIEKRHKELKPHHLPRRALKSTQPPFENIRTNIIAFSQK